MRRQVGQAEAEHLHVHERRLGQGGAALMATHIDLGLPEAGVLDLTPFRAKLGQSQAKPASFNEAFA